MLQQKFKTVLNSALSIQNNRAHKIQAKSALLNIESFKGKTPRSVINECDSYAYEILGSKKYAPWLYVYSAASGGFKEGWIPDNYYEEIVIPKTKGDYGHAMNLKAMPTALFNSDSFPDIGYHVNGAYFDRNYNFINQHEVKDYLFSNTETLVFKVDDSGRGKGVYLFKKSSFELKKNILDLGNGVFQNFISQHNFFEEIMPKSVSTIRLTTVMDDNGKPSLRACILRVAREKETHVMFESNIMIPVNIQSGELYEEALFPNWKTTLHHPETNYIFKNKVIPEFGQCVSEALKLHKKFPFVRCLGWDMVINKDSKVQIMEVNGRHNDIKYHEATEGPCFADLGWDKLWKTSFK